MKDDKFKIESLEEELYQFQDLIKTLRNKEKSLTQQLESQEASAAKAKKWYRQSKGLS